MKKILSIISVAALALLCLGSCNKYNLDGADLKTLTISYGTDGNSLPAISASGELLTKVVVVNQGGVNRDIDWEVSVDNNPSWISVEKTSVTTQFTGTYAGDDVDVEHKAVNIDVQANDTGAKRTAVIRFTVADGSSISTVLTQNK